MASNPLFIIPDFFLHFPNELSNGYFPISFKPKVPIAEFFCKMQRNPRYSILGVDTGHHASFPQKPVVKDLNKKAPKFVTWNFCRIIELFS